MATLWNADRLALRRQLSEVDESVASFYGRLIDELDAEDQPVLDAVRCSVVSYYSRELFDNLPDILHEDGIVERRAGHQIEERDACDRVVKLTAQQMESLQGCVPSEGALISGELASALVELAEAHSKGSLSGRLRDSITIAGRIDPSTPALNTFETARSYLTRRQHANLASRHEPLNKDEYLRHLAVLEAVLHVRLSSFFQVADDLRALVHEAEREAKGEIDDAYVQSALLLLGGYQHRRIFYRMLSDKKWAGPLFRNGAFDSAPLDNGGDGAVLWPEGDYLLRVVEDRPDIVDNVCDKLRSATNPAVRGQFIRMVSGLPVELCFKHRATIGGWAADLRRDSWYVDHRDLSALASRMLSAADTKKKREKTEHLFKTIFVPTFEGGSSLHHMKYDAVAVIPSYCYREELEYVRANSMGKCDARLIQTVIERYDGSSCESRGVEFGSPRASYRWRPCLTPCDGLLPDEYGDALIDALLADLTVESPKTVAQLDKALNSKSGLVRRIAVVALARHVERLPRECARNEGSADGFSACATIVQLAQSVLDDFDSMYWEMEVELRDFARACLEKRGAFDCAAVHAVLERMTDLDLVRFAGMDAGGKALYELDDTERRAVGAFMLAASLGKDLLTAEQGRMLDEFERVFGPTSVDEAFGPAVVESWGYESPKSYAEIIAMLPQEILDFLDSWCPAGIYDGPSVMGLANSLCEAVALKPDLLGPYVMELRSTQPAYIGAYLRGMVQAVRNGHPADVIDAIPLCDWLTRRPFDEDEYRMDNIVSPQTLGYAMHSAADLAVLLSDYLPELGAESQDAIFGIGKRLVEMREPIAEREMLASPTMRHAIHLNLLRGMGAFVLAKVAIGTGEDALREPAAQCVERLVGGGCDQVLASALGASVPRSLQEDAGAVRWLIGLVSSACYELASLDCFLWSMLSGQALGHELFIEVEGLMTRFLELVCSGVSGTDEPVYEDLLVKIGILLCVEWSNLSDGLPTPLWQLWRRASSCQVRHKVLRWACQQAGKEEVPAPFLEFAMDYWDEVANLVEDGHEDAKELTGIFLLAGNPSVPLAWLRPRIVKEARLHPSMVDVGQANERITQLARSYPSDALELLKCCVEDKDDRGGFVLAKIAIPVLAYCLEAADEELRRDAQSVMDSLGAQGMIGLSDDVKRYAADHADAELLGAEVGD